MVLTVLRKVDDTRLQCVVFFASGKRTSINPIADYAEQDQQLLQQNFAVLADLNGYRRGLTEQQYVALLEAS